jgi:cytochrome c oxidase subunit 2
MAFPAPPYDAAKENSMRISAIVLVGALFAAATVAGPTSAAAPAGTALPTINIVATANQKFAPDHAVLHVGKRQTLRFTSTGGVHGIISKDLGIPSTMIGPGKPVSVSITPKKAGTYKIPCSVMCGPNHADMALTISVKP